MKLIQTLLITSLLSTAAAAQTVARIPNPQPSTNARFGDAISTDGAWLMVGAPGEANGGAVYVYALQNGAYVQRSRLVASDGASNDSFGAALDISGSTAVIGAWKDSHAAGSGAGSAYVFEIVGGTWTERAKLLAPDAATADAFGISVGVANDDILVGAFQDDINGVGQNAGSAHLFRRSAGNWAHAAKLVANDGNQFDAFGFSVAISGDNLLVGARDVDAGAGAVYAYRQNGADVNFLNKFVSNDRVTSDSFGFALALDGDTALIGAPKHTGSVGTLAGAAYVFTRTGTGWAQLAKWVAPGTQARDQLGYAVALSGNLAVLGAPQITLAGSSSGVLHVYQRFGARWSPHAQLMVADAAPFDSLGAAVAVIADTALAGAPAFNEPSATDSGSVVQFTLSLPQFRDGFEQ
jgi:hypothetical protein